MGNCDDDGLLWAAYAGQLGQVRKIISRRPELVNQTDDYGTTALILCAEQGHLQIAEYLLRHNADPNHKDQGGKTALLKASKHDHLKLAKLLLEHHADPNQEYQYNNSALIKAVGNGNTELIKLLLQRPTANYSHDERDDALRSASSQNNLELVKLILKYHPNSSDEARGVSLISASRIGNLQLATVLLEHHANLNNYGMHGHSALIEASKAGNLQLVKLLLQRGADVNQHCSYGRSALIEASEAGNVQLVKLLLQRGADVNQHCNYGHSALFKASRCSRLEVARVLLEHSANPNCRDTNGRSAIIELSRYREVNLKLIELLLQHNADPNYLDEDGYSALIWATQRSNLSLAKLLLKYHADPNKGVYMYPLHISCESDDLQMVSLLLENRADPNLKSGDERTALMMLRGWSNCLEIAKLLLENHADPNYEDKYGETALFAAMRSCRPEVADLLLKNYPNMNHQSHRGVTALMVACEESNHGAITVLLENGADPNICTKFTSPLRALLRCSYYNTFLLVKSLVEYGADINWRNQDGESLLMLISTGETDLVHFLLENGADPSDHATLLKNACQENNLELVKTLLWSYSVDPNETKKDGERFYSALYYACENRNPEIVELLLKQGANLQLKSWRQETLLMFACRRGYVDIVKLLLEYGADPNVLDMDGASVLMYFASLQDSTLMSLLLKYGGNPTLRDKKKRSVLMHYLYWTNPKILELLLEHGADPNEHCGDSNISSSGPILNMLCKQRYYEWAERQLGYKREHPLDRGQDGKPILMNEYQHSHLESLKILLRHGANPNSCDEGRETVLNTACKQCPTEWVRVLLENGANPNHRNQFGCTALMTVYCRGFFNSRQEFVCQEGHLELAALLLEHGACVRISDHHHKTALDYARNAGVPELLEFFSNGDVSKYLQEELKLPQSVVVQFYLNKIVTFEDCCLVTEDKLVKMGIVRGFDRRKFLKRFYKEPPLQSFHGYMSSIARRVSTTRSRRSLRCYDAFLTHEWGSDGLSTHSIVSVLNTKLVEAGLTTWFDGERVSGNIAQQVSEGVQKSKKIIVCVTRRYMEKLQSNNADWCKDEFLAATRVHNGVENMIPLVLEPEMLIANSWRGPLQLHLGGHLYIDFSTEEHREANFQELLNRIRS